MGRRPRPTISTAVVAKTGRGPPVGRGTDGISVTLSQCKRAWRLAIPRPPDPRQTATCESRRNRLDDPPQPSAEPNGTLLLGSEPVVFLTGGVAGNACVSGRARAGSLAQPPGLARLGRRSPHDCWVRFASIADRACAASAVDSQAGSPRSCLRRRSYPVRKSGKKNAVDCRSRGKYFLLTPRAL